MCVLHIKPLVSRRHPAHLVFVLILHPSEMQICGHKTTMRRYYIVMQYVKGVDNAMPCHLTGYDRHIIRTPATQIRWRREKRKTTRKKKREKKKRKDKYKLCGQTLIIRSYKEKTKLIATESRCVRKQINDDVIWSNTGIRKGTAKHKPNKNTNNSDYLVPGIPLVLKKHY